MNELKEAIRIGDEIELYYNDDQALIEPDYKGGWILSFKSDINHDIKLDGFNDIVSYKYKGGSLFDNLKDYQIY